MNSTFFHIYKYFGFNSKSTHGFNLDRCMAMKLIYSMGYNASSENAEKYMNKIEKQE